MRPSGDGSSFSNAGSLRQAGARTVERERWERVKAVFADALGFDESERDAFLARVTGDDTSLRVEVASLLASHRDAESFCETPAAELLASQPSSFEATRARLEPGARLGLYQITAFISAGGMGEVYRAWHTVLGREVAIKTVRADPADDTANRRLIREAQHASVLHHQNICTIYDVGSEGDRPFIAMAFVEGLTLRDLRRTSAPAFTDCVSYAMQVADALEHAHRHGIVHRDLKSSNVMVDGRGQAIVLDFGVAKRVTADDVHSQETTLTAQGTLAGTLSHMAPEVLLGGPADPRSDVWALGVLLHELVAGELPFSGRTPFETSSAILVDPPRRVPSGVPLALRLVIERCLAKSPAMRYQRAADVRDALDSIRRRRAWPLVGRLLVSVRRRAVVGVAVSTLVVASLAAAFPALERRFGGGLPSRVSTLALLPLENATGSPEGDYFAQGVTDALIGQLGAVADVRVLSRGSAAHVARTASTRRDMAQQLGADALIEGRLRRMGERIVIDVRLVEPTTGRVAWSDTYERGGSQVLALQSDIVRAIAAEVRLTLRVGAQQRAVVARTVNPDAYEAYLKGRFEWNKRSRESLQQAVAHFTRAIELDPTYAPAHAALADCYNQFATQLLGTGSPLEWRPRAAAAAIRALQMDPNSAEAHAALGYVHHYDWRWADAEREFTRAIELNPSYALAHLWYANMLMSRRRLDEALARIEVARNLDPYSLIVNTNVSWVLTAAGRYDDAIAQLRRTLALDSTYAQAHSRLVSPLLETGRLTEARAEAESAVRLTGRSSPTLANLAVVSARQGRAEEARTILGELLARARSGYVPPSSLALVHGALHDTTAQLHWWTRAFAERSNAIAYLRSDQAPLMRDPRFRALAVRAGLE